MKRRILLVLLALALWLGCIACTEVNDSSDENVGENVTPDATPGDTNQQEERDQRPWDFHFALTVVEDKKVIKKGENTICLIYITNTSGEDHIFMGYGDGELAMLVDVELFCQTEGGEYRCRWDDRPWPDAEVTECVLKHAATDRGNIDIAAILPDDAPTGVYSVRLSYGEDYQIFENVLTIVE